MENLELDVLEDLGLTAGEIKIYVALLGLGEVSASPIKKKTKMQNSVVHLCLNNLIQKGLVNYVKKGKRNYYRSTNPEHLVDFLEEKKRRLLALLPSLLEKQKEQQNYEVHLYEGHKGLKAVHEDILKELKRGEEFVLLGIPKEAHEEFEPYFLDFHRRRLKLCIKLRGIYKQDAKPYAQLRESMKYTQVRYLPKSLESPMWVNIYNDKTIIFVTKGLLLAIVIENPIVAKSFKEYFELIWKASA
ncbi:hypothetical protein HZB02_05015 [Candidatus Woesearchaeota archaeon]|nr:hypothetical protein [Candidatus Woesearchaeota archaeon]